MEPDDRASFTERFRGPPRVAGLPSTRREDGDTPTRTASGPHWHARDTESPAMALATSMPSPQPDAALPFCTPMSVSRRGSTG